MILGLFQAALLLGLAGLLVSVGVEDARTREIANGKNVAIALLAFPWWWSHGLPLWPEAALQLGLAVAVFAAFCALFALGLMGGGDVKLLGALALWFPFGPLLAMLLVMSVAGGGLSLAFLIERRWRRKTGEIEVPYGVAIAFAALLGVREPILNLVS